MPTPHTCYYSPTNDVVDSFANPIIAGKRAALGRGPALARRPYVSDREMDAILDEEFSARPISNAGAVHYYRCCSKTAQTEEEGKVSVSSTTTTTRPRQPNDLDIKIHELLKDKFYINGSEMNIPASEIHEYATRILNRSRSKSHYPLTPKSLEILTRWMFSPEHFAHPYPDAYEKMKLSKMTGLTITQLQYWFVNSRRRTWKPFLKMYLKSTSESTMGAH